MLVGLLVIVPSGLAHVNCVKYGDHNNGCRLARLINRLITVKRIWMLQYFTDIQYGVYSLNPWWVILIAHQQQKLNTDIDDS